MKWVVTIETTDREHSHIDVADPDVAAVVISEINDERAKTGKGPAQVRLESYSPEWVCRTCGERRFDTDSDSTRDYEASSTGTESTA